MQQSPVLPPRSPQEEIKYEVLDILREHSNDIQEFIHRLNTAVPEEGFGVMKIAVWTDTLEDHKELLTKLLRSIQL